MCTTMLPVVSQASKHYLVCNLCVCGGGATGKPEKVVKMLWFFGIGQQNHQYNAATSVRPRYLLKCS